MDNLLISLNKSFLENVQNMCIVYKNNKLTFGLIKTKIDKLCRYLIKLGIKNCPIGFCLNRGPNNIIVMLSILRCGCYYVPLDKNYPIERIQYIINDTEMSFIITDINDDNIINVLKRNSKVLNLNKLDNEMNKDHDFDSLINEYKYKQELSYIIYTSGTTGKPKGVVIKRPSLLNLIKSAIKILNIKPKTRIFQYSSIGFDAAGWDIYISLLSGSTLYMATDDLMISPYDCHKYMLLNEINMATVTPSFISGIPLQNIKSLETLIVMGEKSEPKIMDFWCQYCNVYNGYGPTEATIGSTIHKYKYNNNPNNIGKPFDNYKIFLLDDSLNEKEIGEICIGGLGVAKEYWKQPELTSNKFIITKYGRLYKTGDLARKDENGDYIFIGRKDNQIKINGIRIELEEIENLGMELLFIDKTCVIYNKKLIMYYVSNTKEKDNILEKSIKKYLSKRLHRAVVPQHYHRVNKFYMTFNGKVDKNKLPKYINNNVILKPKNKIESEIADVYKKLLGRNNEINVGRNSNFFKLGGDSLKIMYVVSALKDKNIKINNLDIFNYPIVSDLANYAKYIDSKQINHKYKYQNFDMIKLSHQQMNLWYHQSLYPNDSSYNMFQVYSLNGRINENKLISSLQKTIDTHDTLRTKLYSIDDNIIQCFGKLRLNINIEKLSLSDIKFEIIEDIKKPFAMIDNPLIKIRLFKNNDVNNNYVLLIIKHNIIIDAYSEGIIFDSLNNFYKYEHLKPIEYSNSIKYKYSDYVKQNIIDFKNNKIINYWKKQLSDFVPLNLPKNNDSNNNLNSDLDLCKLTKHMIINNFDKFKLENGITTSNIMLTAFNILMWRYTQQSDISIGMQIADRINPKWKNTVGFMVSTLILRNKFDQNFTVEKLMKQTAKTLYDAMKNRHITYDKLLTLCKSNIDVMFVIQTANTSTLKLDNIIVKELEMDVCKNPFPLYIEIYPISSNEFRIYVRYSNMFDNKLINNIIESYETILNDIIKNYNLLIHKIKYLSTKNDLCELSNLQSYNDINTVDYLINEVAIKYPNKIALCYSTKDNNYMNKSITYLKLNSQSNKICNCLIEEYNIKRGDIIGIKMRRCKEFILILLGIIKAGACYVPIDADYPLDRIKYMINDCKPKMLINNDININTFNVPINVQYNTIIKKSSNFNNKYICTHTNNDLIYIIYTSGSTGNPKGCMINHKNLSNVLIHFKRNLKVSITDKIWNLTSMSFDIMALEVFLPLISGAKLLLCPQCVSSNPVSLVNWINNEKPTILQATPTQYSLIVDHIKPNKNLTILVGGEASTTSLIKSLLKITENVYNVYGPTETTIWSTWKKIDSSDNITIGKPILNTNIIVLNNLQPTPFGCIGELCIGGLGVSNGYLNRECLTKKKFIIYNGKKYYRTGDLVKINNDYELVYIGRVDFQVKINGHRIELGEIISVMEIIEHVKRVVIVTKYHNGNIFLVAYYIGKNIKDKIIIEYLRSKLPSYMVPNFIIWLPKFPETLNKKIDVNKLPNPFDNQNFNFLQSDKIIEPRNNIEKLLHKIFTQIIGCEQISVIESVLNVGATSIMFPIFVNKIKQYFNKDITIREFIQNSTISLCAKLIEKK